MSLKPLLWLQPSFFNGKEICTHKGGYLPFRVNITDLIKEDGENVLEVIADNRDHKNVPPGKPAELLDFYYWGGIYRNVWLCVEEKLHITNEIEKNIVKGGRIRRCGPHYACIAFDSRKNFSK